MNIPNTLSIIRLCLVPVFVLVFFSGAPHAGLWAAVVYGIASFTDFLDGYIARHYNMITNLGRVLDPLGDKLFLFAVLACLTIARIIPLWILLIFFVKELTMGLGGLIIHRRAKVDIPPSNYIGKTATVLFFVICVLLMIIPEIPKTAAIILLCACLAVSLTAFVTYLKSFLSIMKASKSQFETGE